VLRYPNLLERFLNFCRFEGHDVEQKAIEFFRFAKKESQEEVEDMIIRFVIFQKERIDRSEITAGALKLCQSRQVILQDEPDQHEI
jgi:hypothetical protein